MRCVVITCTLLASLLGTAAQAADATVSRTVQLEPSLPNDPVKIVKVMLDGVEVKPGVQGWPGDKPGMPVHANDNWLNHIAITLKNISTKGIVFCGVRVFSPDVGDGTPKHPILGSESVIGQRPQHARYSRITGESLDDPSRNPILLEAGEEVTLPAISLGGFDEVKKTIETRQPLARITTVRLGLTTVYFGDGTKWDSNVYYRPDLSSPGKYLVISRQEFDSYRPEASR